MKFEHAYVGVAYEFINPATGQWTDNNPNLNGFANWARVIEEMEIAKGRADRRNVRLMFCGRTVPVEIHSQAEALDIIAAEYVSADYAPLSYSHNDLFDAFEAGYREGWQFNGDTKGYIRGAFEDWLRNKEAESE